MLFLPNSINKIQFQLSSILVTLIDFNLFKMHDQCPVLIKQVDTAREE
jgi:hypothetical protein